MTFDNVPPRRRATVRKVVHCGITTYQKRHSGSEPFAREVAALQTMDSVGIAASPRLVDQDPASLTLWTGAVEGVTLADQEPSPTWRELMVDGFASVAAATRAPGFDISAARQTLLTAPGSYVIDDKKFWWKSTSQLAEKVRLEIDDLYGLLARLPVSLVMGDVCPTNVVVAQTGNVMLVDWEFGHFGPAVLDLAAICCGFPTSRLASAGTRDTSGIVGRFNVGSGMKIQCADVDAAIVFWALVTSKELVGLERAQLPTKNVAIARSPGVRCRALAAARTCDQLGWRRLAGLLVQIAELPRPQ